nr:retrotransposon Orf1 [Tanacetum cinerariifolium]
MVKSSSSSKNEIFDDSFCSTSCKKNTESLNTKITELSEKLSDSKTMLYHYKLGLSQVEARLVEFKNQEIKFCEKIRGLEFNVKCKNNRIERLTNELEELKKEKEGLESKLTGFESATKVLDTLLESQGSYKNKEGLGYNDTITDYSMTSPSIESNSSDLHSNNSSVSGLGESSGSIMSKPMLKFVKAGDSLKIIKTTKGETARKPPVRYEEMYINTSKSPKLRGNQRNWNNLMNQRHGSNFVMKNKACFKCGNFDHLAYDCGLWVEKGKNWPKNNYAHKNVTPEADLFKTASRVKGLERDLKARTPPIKIHKVDVRGRSRDKVLAEYTKKLEKAEKARDELKLILEKLQNLSKSLNALVESQENQSDKGYHEAPPSFTRNYIPPKRDLRLIDEHFKCESVDVSSISLSDGKTVKTVDVKGYASSSYFYFFKRAVGVAAVASPARVLELDTHSSSKDDPLESSLPAVSVAPMVLPFLCSYDLESDTEIPDRHVSPTPHDAMLTRWRSRDASRSSSPTTSILEIPDVPISPAPSAIVAPSSEFPLAHIVALT